MKIITQAAKQYVNVITRLLVGAHTHDSSVILVLWICPIDTRVDNPRLCIQGVQFSLATRRQYSLQINCIGERSIIFKCLQMCRKIKRRTIYKMGDKTRALLRYSSTSKCNKFDFFPYLYSHWQQWWRFPSGVVSGETLWFLSLSFRTFWRGSTRSLHIDHFAYRFFVRTL